MFQNWGIASRMFLVNLLSFLTVVLVVSGTYWLGALRIERELQSQGQQLVELLADSVEYGVVSGNTALLDYQLQQVLTRNKNISSIEIADRYNKRILSKQNAGLEGSLKFSAAITIRGISFNSYDLEEDRLSSTAAAPPSVPTPEVQSGPVGFVTIKLSRAALVAERQVLLFWSTALAAVLMLMNIAVSIKATSSLVRPLLATIDAIRLMRKRNALVFPEKQTGGEIGELQATLTEMAGALFQSQQSLENKVRERTAALAQLNAKLEKMNADTQKLSAERRRLLQQVTNAAEAERKTIAVEIHDQLNASLIVARLETQHILDVLGDLEQPSTLSSTSPLAQVPSAKEAASKVLALVGDLYKLARGIVKRLRPEVIDTLGLVLALDEMVRDYDRLHPGCYFELNAKGQLEDLQDDLALSIYRLVQEALSNIIKHANASIAQVSLVADERSGRVILKVTDDGKGFDAHSVGMGLGLIGMRERVLGLDGELTLESVPGEGTTVLAYFPLLRKSLS